MSPATLDLPKLDRDTRLGFLGNDDFISWCDASGIDNPAEYLLLPSELSRADKCSSPVVLSRVAESTGEATELVLPCGSPNEHKCLACSEFAARLRQRQIMRGIEESGDGVRLALFTLTAPSWGKVHRASISAKDEYKRRALTPPQREVSLKMLQRSREACPCGLRHRWDEDLIGTPLSSFSYGYASEAIWSKNLPNLVSSTIRRLRYLAKGAGIDKESLATFGVFERQKRGALHFHCLVVVRDNPAGFDTLAREIKSSWSSPTSLIPDHVVTWLKSDVVSHRCMVHAGGKIDMDKAIPKAKWKGGEIVPATTWGKVFDWSEVTPTKNLDGDAPGNGYLAAAGYLSKYLTKGGSTSSLPAMSKLPMRQADHFNQARSVAGALFADLTVVESKIDAINRELDRLQIEMDEASVLPEDASPEYEAEILHHLDRAEQYAAFLVDELRQCGRDLDQPRSQRIITSLFDSFSIETSRLNVGSVASSEGELLAARGLSIRLNKLLDNAGFTGSLSSISRWGTTLTDLKNEMEAYMRDAGAIIEDPETYTYELDTAAMREKSLRRAPYAGRIKRRELLPGDCPTTEDLLKILQSGFGPNGVKFVRETLPGDPPTAGNPLF